MLPLLQLALNRLFEARGDDAAAKPGLTGAAYKS